MSLIGETRNQGKYVTQVLLVFVDSAGWRSRYTLARGRSDHGCDGRIWLYLIWHGVYGHDVRIAGSGFPPTGQRPGAALAKTSGRPGIGQFTDDSGSGSRSDECWTSLSYELAVDHCSSFSAALNGKVVRHSLLKRRTVLHLRWQSKPALWAASRTACKGYWFSFTAVLFHF
jgi:hypothetical protein